MLVLQTERLQLRWFSEQDADFIVELLNDPGWIEHIGDRGVRTSDDARAWIASRLVDGYWRQGIGFWAVQRRGSGEPIGLCGLIQRDSLPEVDVGYAFLPRHRGQGHAHEAVMACLNYGREALGLRRILAITTPGNLASQRVLQAAGLRLEDRRTLAGETRETLVYAWQDGAPDAPAKAGDEAQIDTLTQRFMGLFDNRGGAIARLPMLPWLCLPETRIVKATEGRPESMDLRAFMTPRAELLGQGRLTEFEEHEVQGRTQIFGHMAERWFSYRKSGVLDGQPHGGTGRKSLHFARTPKGWRICAVIWDDDAAA